MSIESDGVKWISFDFFVRIFGFCFLGFELLEEVFFQQGSWTCGEFVFFVITKTKKKIKETDIVNNNNNYVINIKSTFDKQLVTINKKKQQNRMTNVVAQQLSF